MKNFKDFYNQLKEAVPAQSQHAGEDLSSKEASTKAPDSSAKKKKDFEPNGPGVVTPPEAGKDYSSGKA